MQNDSAFILLNEPEVSMEADESSSQRMNPAGGTSSRFVLSSPHVARSVGLDVTLNAAAEDRGRFVPRADCPVLGGGVNS